MNKKAFTLLELMLVTVILAIIATSAIPFMINSFGGFNRITTQETMINSLQEISSVISRRIIFDNESSSVDHLNEIINSFANSSTTNSYDLANGISINKLTASDVTSCTYTQGSITKTIPNCIRITLTATKNDSEHKLSFIVFPAIE
ncbi:MAG: type II secretion system protein [Candidatus Riflebacteria bacterium]|nr:type II secretion system protein [Candidatus Riflebacteria bacterium]